MSDVATAAPVVEEIAAAAPAPAPVEATAAPVVEETAAAAAIPAPAPVEATAAPVVEEIAAAAPTPAPAPVEVPPPAAAPAAATGGYAAATATASPAPQAPTPAQVAAPVPDAPAAAEEAKDVQVAAPVQGGWLESRAAAAKDAKDEDPFGEIEDPDVPEGFVSKADAAAEMAATAATIAKQPTPMQVERPVPQVEVIYEGGALAYVVLQGLCIFKRSENPKSENFMKKKRRLGHIIYATGRLWRGRGGGLWAEVDVQNSPEDPGWSLVEGPGFDCAGPLLWDASSDEDATLVQVRYAKDIIFKVLMPSKATIGNLIQIMSSRTGLHATKVILTNALPPKNPATGHYLPFDFTSTKDILENKTTIAAVEMPEDQTLNLCYTGIYNEDFERPK